MDDKLICYRCRSEIYRHQGTAYYGYYIAHKSPDDCTAYLNRKIQELEARLAEQAWRPVTGDDLPDDHDEALVTVENDDGYRFVDMAEFTVGGNWWQRIDEGWRELKRVTHWLPLPPPPAATE